MSAALSDQKRERAFAALVEKLQRSIENTAQSIRRLMQDIIKPFWAHTRHRVLPVIHDGFFTQAFSFLEPQLDEHSGDLVVPLRCSNPSGGYVIPFSATPDRPQGIVSRAPAQMRLSSRCVTFTCLDQHWLKLCHGPNPPPGREAPVLYQFPDGYWETTKLELADLRQEHALTRYTQIVGHFETVFRQYDVVVAEMNANKSKLVSHVVVPIEFRPQNLFFLQTPPNVMKRKRGDEKAAMEAEFATAALAGEKPWFQAGTKDELRTQITRSDGVCDRMLDMLAGGKDGGVGDGDDGDSL